MQFHKLASVLLLLTVSSNDGFAQDTGRETPASSPDDGPEPSVGLVLEWASKIPDAEIEDIESLRRRARRTGWLPVLRFALRQGSAQDLANTGRFTEDQSLGTTVSLVFNLDRAFFSTHELPLAREQRGIRAEKTRFIREVVAIYYERRRLQIEIESVGPDPVRLARIGELTALLDYFTSGRFTRFSRRRFRRAL